VDVQLITPADERWQRLLQRTSHDVYHLPGYGGLYARREDQVLGLYVQGAEGELLMPLIVRPLPDLGDARLAAWRDAASPYGYPGPLIRGRFSAAERAAFTSAVLKELRRSRIVSCFVRGHPFIQEGEELLYWLGAESVGAEVMCLDLEGDEEELWRSVREGHRRAIRRLEKSGYSVRFNDWTGLEQFAAIYESTMRRVSATHFYFFDPDYFDRLRTLLSDHLNLVSVVGPDGKLAAGVLMTCYRGVAHSHLSATAEGQLALAPSKLAYDASWRRAKEQGARSLNWGGGLGRSDDPLLNFKRGFSNSARPFRTFRIVCDPERYQWACEAARLGADDRTGFFPAYRRPVSVEPERSYSATRSASAGISSTENGSGSLGIDTP